MSELTVQSKRIRIQAGWLKSTWVIIGGMIAGVLIGIFNKQLANQLAPLGNLYLSLLKMCVIPIMVTALISSVGRLMMAKGSSSFLKKMLLVFIIAMLTVSAVGLLLGMVGKPGEGLSEQAKSAIGQVILDTELSGQSATAVPAAEESGVSGVIRQMVPSNIFSALVDGNNLQILFFSLLFGVMLGFVKSNVNEQLLDLLEVVFKVFQKAISFTMYILPFGLLSIMAGQVAATGVDLLLALIKFVIMLVIGCLILMGVSSVVMMFAMRVSWIKSIMAVKDTILIAFGTRNSIATMPSMLYALEHHFKLDIMKINLIAPIGIILCRYSMVLVFSTALVFIAQLYYMPFGLTDLLIVLFGSVLAAVAGAGAPGVVSISMLSMIAAPMGIPFSAAAILLLAVFPIIDPLLTAANMHVNCATAAVIAKPADPSAAIKAGQGQSSAMRDHRVQVSMEASAE